jgi:hypothetical protein
VMVKAIDILGAFTAIIRSILLPDVFKTADTPGDLLVVALPASTPTVVSLIGEILVHTDGRHDIVAHSGCHNHARGN